MDHHVERGEQRSNRDLCVARVSEDVAEQLLFCDGFDDAILGVLVAFGQPPRVVYSIEKMVAQLETDGLDRDEALEYLEFNTFGAWVGEFTPVFVDEIIE
jgi:hypothetical protein